MVAAQCGGRQLTNFDALDKVGQDAVPHQAALAEIRGWQISEKNTADNLKGLAVKGVKIDTVIGDALKKNLNRLTTR